MKTVTILYLCLLISLLTGISITATSGMRAYATHIATMRLAPTPEQKERLDQIFDTQVSTASGGGIIVFVQIVAFCYVRKLRRENTLEA